MDTSISEKGQKELASIVFKKFYENDLGHSKFSLRFPHKVEECFDLKIGTGEARGVFSFEFYLFIQEETDFIRSEVLPPFTVLISKQSIACGDPDSYLKHPDSLN